MQIAVRKSRRTRWVNSRLAAGGVMLMGVGVMRVSLAVVVGCCGGHCGKTGAVKALPVWWGWVGYVLVGGVRGRYGVHHSGVQVGDGGVCAGETVAGEQVVFAASVSVGVEIDNVVEVGSDSGEAHQNAIPLVALFALAQRGGFVVEDVLR